MLLCLVVQDSDGCGVGGRGRLHNIPLQEIEPEKRIRRQGMIVRGSEDKNKAKNTPTSNSRKAYKSVEMKVRASTCLTIEILKY